MLHPVYQSLTDGKLLCSLQKLNVDVLVQIFEHSRSKGGLRALSMTCRSMREATVPVLFESCEVLVKKPITAEYFIPPALWTYVRYRDYCSCTISPETNGRCIVDLCV